MTTGEIAVSSGLLLFCFTPGVLLIPGKWVRYYPAIAMATALIYHWLLPASGSLTFDFMDFGIELYSFREPGWLVGSILALFGLFYFLYMIGKPRARFFYFFAMIHIASGLSILFSGDLLTFFVFWELLTISAVALILKEGGWNLFTKYFLYQLTGAICLLTGIALIYTTTGSIATAEAAGRPAAAAFFLPAIFIKAAFIPFHTWMLATYPGVSRELAILLSAYATKIGVFGIIVLVPGIDLAIVGGLLALAGVIYALRQSNLRRFLSFHIISQIGFMVAGVSSTGNLAHFGGTYHIMSHVLYKGLLFMIAAVLSGSFGSDDMTEMKGRGGQKRFLLGAALIASASISGLPPFNGYISKSFLSYGLQSRTAIWLLTIASVGTAISFTKFIYFCFLNREYNKEVTEIMEEKRDAGGKGGGPQRVHPAQYAAILALAAACIIMGVFPGVATGRFAVPEYAFYRPVPLLKGLASGVAGILIFSTLFAPLSKAISYIAPEGIHLDGYAANIADAGLELLQALHSGHLQHYLLWAFSFFVLLWLFVLLL